LAIRTVFWDIGGVLLTNGFGRRQRAGMYDALGLAEGDLAEFEARREDANWHWERGLIDDREFFARTLFYKPQTFTLADVWQALEAQQKVQYPDSFAILDQMQQRGQVRIATLNNESRELNNLRLKRFSLRRYFSFCICSGYVGEMKPAPGIYRAALEIGGDAPGEALFIDDKEENVLAAQDAGFIGLHFTGPEDLRVQLGTHGIELGIMASSYR
jgi:putative hydrolase of the HAD superfamily